MRRAVARIRPRYRRPAAIRAGTRPCRPRPGRTAGRPPRPGPASSGGCTAGRRRAPWRRRRRRTRPGRLSRTSTTPGCSDCMEINSHLIWVDLALRLKILKACHHRKIHLHQGTNQYLKCRMNLRDWMIQATHKPQPSWEVQKHLPSQRTGGHHRPPLTRYYWHSRESKEFAAAQTKLIPACIASTVGLPMSKSMGNARGDRSTRASISTKASRRGRWGGCTTCLTPLG